MNEHGYSGENKESDVLKGTYQNDSLKDKIIDNVDDLKHTLKNSMGMDDKNDINANNITVLNAI